MRMSDVDTDFKTIKANGFNTVVLAIPWAEFQPVFEPCCLYNDVAFQKLDLIMQKAEAIDLKVLFRLGYLWSFDPTQQAPGMERSYMPFTDDRALEAFAKLARRLADRVQPYKYFSFAFLSWEDFFLHGLFLEENRAKTQNTVLETQYKYFLRETFSLQQLREFFPNQRIISYDDVPFPVSEVTTKNGDSRLVLFHRFWDYLLIERLFKHILSVFPRLTMEVRIDGDRFITENSDLKWLRHFDSYEIPQSDIVVGYYAPFWGMQNKRDFIGSNRAIEQLRVLIQEMREHSKKRNVFIDQLNFFDETPGFEDSIRIYPNQINQFLSDAAVVLSSSVGYSLWTLKDYVHSYLYNASFQKEFKGWVTKGNPGILRKNQFDRTLLMKSGDQVSQEIPSWRGIELPEKIQARFCLDAGARSRDFAGYVTVGNEKEKFHTALKPFSGNHACWNSALPSDGSVFTMGVEKGTIEIETLYLFKFLYKSELYPFHGEKEGEYLRGIRELNRQLLSFAPDDHYQEPGRTPNVTGIFEDNWLDRCQEALKIDPLSGANIDPPPGLKITQNRYFSFSSIFPPLEFQCARRCVSPSVCNFRREYL